MKSILFIFFTFSALILYAQPRVIKVESEQEEKSGYLASNAIKLHPLEFISSDFSLYYERRFLKNISLEVGYGFTLADNFGHIFTPTKNGPINPNTKIGYSYSLGLRIYPSEVFDRFYIAPEYKFRKYNWNRDFSNYFGFKDVDGVRSDESRTHSIPRITFGYLAYLFEDIFIDIHFGFGINSQTETLYNPFTSEIEINKLSPRFKINGGFKIGFVF